MAATWECIEFKMGNDELVVWLNGTQSNAISTTNWAKVGDGANGAASRRRTGRRLTSRSASVGSSTPAPRFGFDDVALGYSRIGCQ
ncbi:MAG TPA: hypothetical protein VFQ35_17680 [Polyangiaceae bacterium]|nr:hypothetical protein [Polyangiaceae bacterium]